MITTNVIINRPIEKVWDAFSNPLHIIHWNFASPEWHCPAAKNDLQPGGLFSYTMAAKDGSMSFEFGGVYDRVELHKTITYTLGDGRKVQITFLLTEHGVEIEQKFDPESINPIEMQQAGWQSILNNFKEYTLRLEP
jgi:uncharacterized protein YndB with AHSA1/START domain